MKSIQTKFIILILTAIVLTEIATSAIGSYSFGSVLKEDSNNILKLTSEKTAEELNALFGRIEQSVDVMAEQAIDNLESVAKLKNDSQYLQQYTKNIERLGVTVANKTAGTIGVYIRFNPNILPSDSGFFKLRSLGEKNFRSIEVTDFSQYDENDESVSWYYQPIKNGEPTWILPYYDKHIDVYMISYVVPLFKDGETIGIIGMDIDYAYLTKLVDEIKLYDTGHAFLTNLQYEVLHSKHFETGTQTLPSNMEVVHNTLSNNMYLGVAVPQDEIMNEMNSMLFSVLLTSLIAITLSVVVTALLAKSIIKPLKHLEGVAKEVAEGNLDVDVVCNSKDEVGVLAQAISKTTKELKKQIDFINDLAYLDTLTGIKNHTAYSQELTLRDKSENEKYAVFVIDLNGLKDVNDMLGHHYGNELLINISKIITDVFGYENSYRIGGDEFVVVMSVENEPQAELLENKFKEKLNAQCGNICAKAAIGYAFRKSQESYDEIFNRADEKMYLHKQEMKKRGENSKILT